MIGMDCINQQAREHGLTKRSQAERLAIANSLIASVWEEYLNGSIDRSNLQLAVNIQINVNRIVWKLNELNNPNSPNISKALDALDCISRQKAVDAFDCTDELIVSGSANAQNVMNYINKVIGKIKALPSVQSKNEERMEKSAQYVPNDDLISRKAAIEALLELVEARRTWVSIEDARKEISGIDASMCAIHDLPSAQPEIIHCRDCKHRGEKPIADGRYWCEIHDTFMYYCSDAERRIDEEVNIS